MAKSRHLAALLYFCILAIIIICRVIENYGVAPIDDTFETSEPANKSGRLYPDDSNHRRLATALPDGGCHLTLPVKPQPGTPITYAASYPGCGARMTWNLVEALTGLQSGDDWNNNGRGSEVVTVKTHYPNSNGVLPEFDEKIGRAFIVIRNPIKSIPSLFNHIYEIRNHIPVHTTKAPVEEWVKWRNAYWETEIEEYKKFIIFWMDRYSPENRHIFSYEDITDEQKGAATAVELSDFLGRVDGVDPITAESVPCVWRAVVKNIPPPQQAAQIMHLQQISKEQLEKQAELEKAEEKEANDQLQRRLNMGHFDSKRKGDARRPFTIKHLDQAMDALLEVAERYETEHAPLHKIMMGYYEEIKRKKEHQLRNHPGG